MDKSYFTKLIRKHEQGITTPEEENFLFKYYDLLELEPNKLDTLTEKEKERLKSQIQVDIWRKINLKNKESTEVKYMYCLSIWFKHHSKNDGFELIHVPEKEFLNLDCLLQKLHF